jgi:hypothetical protein
MPEHIKKGSFALLKHLPMLAGKTIPVLGSVLSAGSAVNRLGSGDLLGAGLDIGSAITSPFAPMLSLPIDLINTGRDILNSNDNVSSTDALNEKLERKNFMKNAASQFAQDLADPQAGLDSDLYQAISPIISTGTQGQQSPVEAKRLSDLHNQVRQGLVGLEYMTGLKKNKAETFYDAHPVEATATDALKNSLPAAAALGLGGVAENYRRQWSNLRKTEPAQMSRSGNPGVDVTNASELLESDRPDIARLFGTLKDDSEGMQKRLKLLDRLQRQHAPGSPESFTGKLQAYNKAKEDAVAAHTSKINELQSKLNTGAVSDRGQVESVKALMASQTAQHQKELETLEGVKKKLLAEARQNPSSAALEKYVNLQESLRRGNINGGLSSAIGEQGTHIPGFKDLAQKYNVTGAQQHFDPEILAEIAKENSGGKFTSEQIKNIVSELENPANATSGLRRFWSKAKIPTTRAAIAGAGGLSLYHLLKMMQNQNYSGSQMNEWKKNLLKSRGDFEAAQELESSQPQQQLR